MTGGSAGLGKALAIYLVKHGAHVTIVARDAKKLGETETLLKGLTVNSTQLVHSISADLTSAESSNSALDTAMEHHGGRAPDYALLCAGFSKPKFFIDATTADLQAVSRVSAPAMAFGLWRGLGNERVKQVLMRIGLGRDILGTSVDCSCK